MTDTLGSRLVSYEQAKSLIDFMGQHLEFARGSLRTLEARHTSKRLWAHLTGILNTCRGTRKTADGWSKYWSDFKNKLKNKTKPQKRKKSGSSSKKGLRPLTKLEKRVLVILGPQFNKRKPRDTFIEPISNNLPKVKQEEYHENHTNEFSPTQEKVADRLSGDDGVSDDSGESSDKDYVQEMDQNSNEPTIQSLYPKWLIEVEKKRADAELIRAKAEEQRAGVAIKNSEAALIQAEAMRTLSEAASKQADAITRIATLLENGTHNDLLSIVKNSPFT